MPNINIPTRTGSDGTTYHIIQQMGEEVAIECSGKSCILCNASKEKMFKEWEKTIPVPLPPKGKKYKDKNIARLRGQTIKEICYSCREIPCYICRRTKCELWWKEKEREGQEEGCVHWEKGRCTSFTCEKGVIKSPWEE